MIKNYTISVIGLGYVGLPIATAFSKKTTVIGFDINQSRINQLNSAIDHTGEVQSEDLKNDQLHFTSDVHELKKANFHIVTVPTPVLEDKTPDFTAMVNASELLSKVIKKGDIIVYESTVYPGATEEYCLPILEKGSGLKSKVDFFIGYSPERINPGDKEHSFTKIKKVVSAQTKESLQVVVDVYCSVIEAGVHPVSSIKVAEAAKVIENTQRDLNIALINELAMIFHKIGIDTQEVLEAAKTKWNFLPFTPGLVGGHCIGVDPYYLTHLATRLGHHPQVILSGRKTNDEMGPYIANQTIKLLESTQAQNKTVTILGLTFKENIPDLRNTKVVDIVNALKAHQLNVQVHDPLASPEEAKSEYGLDLVKMKDLKPSSAVILAVSHKEYLKSGWKLCEELLLNQSGVVIDIKAVLDPKLKPEKVNLWRL